MESSKENLNSYQNINNPESKTKSTVDRQWVTVTAYQPVDIVTKTLEVPVTKTIEKIVPKTIIQEKIIHVPKNVTHVVEKIVEVPEVKYIEKIVEVPHIHYKNKYVPKIEVVEKIIERKKIIEKWHDKTVEVPQIKEVVRYKQIDDVEEIIKYIPKNSGNIDWEAEYKKYLQRKELSSYNAMDESAAYQKNMNAYNAYNEHTYAQNAYDRTSEYANNYTNLDVTTDYNNVPGYVQNNYYNNVQNKINYDNIQTIPRSKIDINSASNLKRLPSEEVKPVGCCTSACR